MGRSLVDLLAFMEKQQQMMFEREAQLESKLEAQRQETKAKLEQHRQETDQQRREMEKQRTETAEVQLAQRDASLGDQQLVALQSRLEALHAAKLLADNELYMYAIEDVVADSDQATPGGDDPASPLITLSTRMVGDDSFARQLRRKYV